MLYGSWVVEYDVIEVVVGFLVLYVVNIDNGNLVVMCFYLLELDNYKLNLRVLVLILWIIIIGLDWILYFGYL